MTDVPWTAPDPASLALFVAIVVALWALLVFGVWRLAGARTGLAVAGGVAVWAAISGAAPLAGWFSLGLPAFFGFLLASNGVPAAVAVSPLGRTLARAPLWALIGFQAFRLPLEGVLHVWGESGVIPMSMTWEGQNLDVITGVAAVVAAPVVAWGPERARRVAGWVFNVLGLVLLLNVMRVAVLSSPVPVRVFGDPPLALAFHFPTVWIVPFCVGGALLGHLVTFRHLWGERAA